jgi:hypothetical protein
MARSGYGVAAEASERIAELVAYEDLVLDEDLAILERYRDHSLALDLKVEVHSRADRLSVAYRRVLADLASRA